MKVICFHNPDEINGYLSNWWLSDFTVDGRKFSSAEQWMMFSKAILFGDHTIAAKILATTDVKKIKLLGKKVTPFDGKTWEANREEVMFKGLKAKFEQNPDLLEQLLSTGDNILAECAVNDKIWGIGLRMKSKANQDPSQWQGLNLLGKTLMRVRENLKDNKKDGV